MRRFTRFFLLPLLVAGATLGLTAEGPNDPAPVIQARGTVNGKKVLFDNTHGETAGAADWVIDGGFSDFANALADNGFYVKELRKTGPLTLADLTGFDVLVFGESNFPFKTTEQAALLQFVQNGGAIFFIADHYNADRNKNRWDGSECFNGYRRGAWANPAKGMSAEEAASAAMQGVASSDWLATNFGVRFRYNALGDIVANDIVAPAQSFNITAGVSTVAMHAGGTVAIIDPAKAKGIVYLPPTTAAWSNAVDQGVYNGGGRAEGPFAAIAKVGLGKAAFIGDSSPVEDATPKYLKEETGAAKTTYAGWQEQNDATLLVNIVKWLATGESYTSLSQVSGLQLDTPTALLAMEDPATSTEPQAEPWATPAAGYKWWDMSTYKPGSYGYGTSSTANTVTATISAPATNVTIASGTAVSFAGSATDSNSAATLSYDWVFGDGGTGTGASASHTFTNTGSTAATFTVTFTATDNTGAKGTATRTITVNPATTSGVFTEVESNNSLGTANSVGAGFSAITGTLTTATDVDVFALSIPAGQTLTVAMTGPTGPDWDLALLNAAGTTLVSSTGLTTSEKVTYKNTGSTALRVYPKVYVYSGTSTSPYTLALSYAAASANTVTASITTPSANVTLASGTAQSFAGTATDSASGQTLTYAWTFGDGGTATGATASHTYTNSGTTAVTYTATLTATDTTGAKGTATRTITVNPASTGSSLSESFDSGTKTSYTTGTVALATGTWTLNDALLGNTTSDPHAGTQSVRVRNSGKATMGFNFATGAKTVTVKHAVYGTDGASTWGLWYSTNGGSTWIQAGSSVTASSSTLSTATFTVNVTGAIRFELRKTDGSANRMNWDDFKVSGY